MLYSFLRGLINGLCAAKQFAEMGCSGLEWIHRAWTENHSLVWQRIHHEHEQNPLGDGPLANSQITIENCEFPGRGGCSPRLKVYETQSLVRTRCNCCHKYGDPEWVGSYLFFYFRDGGYDDPYLKVYVSVKEGQDWDAKSTLIKATTAKVSETGLVTVVLHDGRQFTAELPVPSEEAYKYASWLRDWETGR